MNSEMHTIQKKEKPTILQTIMQLQNKVVLKAGFKISCQKSFLHLLFLSYSSTFILALNFTAIILSCESEKFVGGHENRYLRKDL